jgi:hypothetical protein
VPHGDFNCLQIAEDAIEKENDYDVIRYFPTG